MMGAADAPRASDDLDGRGTLSLAALVELTQWFCDVVLDQLQFMSAQLDFDSLEARLVTHVERDLNLPSTATRIARDVLLRGEVPRGEAARITGLRDQRVYSKAASGARGEHARKLFGGRGHRAALLADERELPANVEAAHVDRHDTAARLPDARLHRELAHEAQTAGRLHHL